MTNKPSVPYSLIADTIRDSSQQYSSPYLQRNPEGTKWELQDDGGNTNINGDPFSLYKGWLHIGLPSVDIATVAEDARALHDALDGGFGGKLWIADNAPEFTAEQWAEVGDYIVNQFGEDGDEPTVVWPSLTTTQQDAALWDALTDEQQDVRMNMAWTYYSNEVATEFVQSNAFLELFECDENA